MMENIKESAVPMSVWLEDPELAQQFQDAYEYVKKTPFSKIFPEKHESSVRQMVYDEVQELFAINPTMPLKSVVTTVLNSLNDDLSAELLLKMTRLIIKDWENAPTEIYAENEVEELV
jgi:uncharacterized membrane protein YheB (UPF0754 family)